MAKAVKLSPPWVKYYREIQELFKQDPAIKIDFDEDANVITLYVEGATKAEALTELLPVEKEFGNVVLKINVVPANLNKTDKLALFKAAFEGNPVLSYTSSATGVLADDLHYVVFANKVVQFFNDDLGDANGMCSTLYQEIAKDVFVDQPGVFYSTELYV